MDTKLRQAKKKYKQTGELVPLLQALKQAGHETFLEYLMRFYVGEATLVLYGKDFIKLTEENSDHLDAVCPCIDCITPGQLAKRLGRQAGNAFLKVFATDSGVENPLTEPGVIELADKLNQDLKLRRQAMKKLSKAIIDVYIESI